MHPNDCANTAKRPILDLSLELADRLGAIAMRLGDVLCRLTTDGGPDTAMPDWPPTVEGRLYGALKQAERIHHSLCSLEAVVGDVAPPQGQCPTPQARDDEADYGPQAKEARVNSLLQQLAREMGASGVDVIRMKV